MYKFSVYWTDSLKVSFLQRVILIHSYMYYELDESVWTDKQYDSVAQQLYNLQNKYVKDWIADNTQYGYVFYDYDSITGFDLWSRLAEPHKKQIIRLVVMYYKGGEI